MSCVRRARLAGRPRMCSSVRANLAEVHKTARPSHEGPKLARTPVGRQVQRAGRKTRHSWALIDLCINFPTQWPESSAGRPSGRRKANNSQIVTDTRERRQSCSWGRSTWAAPLARNSINQWPIGGGQGGAEAEAEAEAKAKAEARVEVKVKVGECNLWLASILAAP